uniref:Capsid protein n=4 Tax=unclassified Orthopicobirnavirus TaxID=2960910 RepID=A0A059TYC9_9VIRU|nr:capsid protein [Picobirnavirus GI/PBV/turkey/USA/MN-1/2011]
MGSPRGKGSRNRSQNQKVDKQRNINNHSASGKDKSVPKREDADKQVSKVTTARTSPLNDISWYDHNPDLTKAAASIPFPYRPGMSIPMSAASPDYKTAVPGVIAVDWAPSIGRAQSVSDPASIAAKEIYAQVRKAYSGSLDADAPDFVIYLLALDSIYSYISYLRRIYGVLNQYSAVNFVLPDQILHMMKLDDDDVTQLRSNKMQLFQCIVDLTLRARKFACPYVFDYLSRHFWMNENVYMDAASMNAQFFLYNQVAFYKYSMLNTPDSVLAGGLVCQEGPNNGKAVTVDTLYNYGLDLISALASSEDAYTISGYLMRAYEGSAAFTLPDLDYGYSVDPVFVPEVLTQFENTFCVENYFYNGDCVEMGALTTNNITQDPRTNTLLCSPEVVVPTELNSIVNGPVGVTKPFLNMHVDAPTDKEVMIASRMIAHIAFDTSEKSIILCGSEIPIRMRMFIPTGSGLANQVFNVLVLGMDETIGGSASTLQVLFKLTNFNNGPMCRVYRRADSGAFAADVAVIGDMHNATSLSVDALDNINRVAMYSEFGVFGR